MKRKTIPLASCVVAGLALAVVCVSTSPASADVTLFSDNGDGAPGLPGVDVGGPWLTNADDNLDGVHWLWHNAFTAVRPVTLSEGPLAPGGSALIQAEQQATIQWTTDTGVAIVSNGQFISHLGEMLFTARTGLGDASSEVFRLRYPEQDPVSEIGDLNKIRLEYYDPAANGGAGGWLNTGHHVGRRTLTEFTVALDFAAQTWDLTVKDNSSTFQLDDLPFATPQSSFDHVAFQYTDNLPGGSGFVRVGLVEVTTVPEPSSWGLAAVAAAIPLLRRRLIAKRSTD